MGDGGIERRRRFRLRLLGYSRAEVDRFVGEMLDARHLLEDAVARLREAEPLTHIGDDLANLLGTFAVAVSSARDEAAAHASLVRLEADTYARQVHEAADAYAEQRKAEADQVVGQSQAHAWARVNAIVAQARDEVAVLVREQMTIGEALDRVAVGIDASRDALARLVTRDDGQPGAQASRTVQPPRVALVSGVTAPVQPVPPQDQ